MGNVARDLKAEQDKLAALKVAAIDAKIKVSKAEIKRLEAL